jgi:hypothetical protein
LAQSTGVHRRGPGELEVMAARDARMEACGILGGSGSDPGSHRIEWRLARADTPLDAARAAVALNRPLTLAAAGQRSAGPAFPVEVSLAQLSGSGIVSTLKLADRGQGTVVRVLLFGPARLQLAPLIAGSQLVPVDAVEHDLGPGAARTDSLSLAPDQAGSIATIRLR